LFNSPGYPGTILFLRKQPFMIRILILFFTLHGTGIMAQQQSFPESWTGNWKGELNWYKTGNPVPQKVNMELRIQPADTAGQYTWQLIYGSPTEDNRPYLLRPVDQAKGHWVVDEKNGILLDQYWTGDKLCGAFTVKKSTIINKYWMEGDKLMVDFLTIGSIPVSSSGAENAESGIVDSYRVGGYQIAILQRR